MRRIPLSLLGLLVLAGCTRYQGPLEVRRKDRADAPGYSIPEQEQRGRERYTMPSDDYRIGPSTYMSSPDPVGIGNSPAVRRW
jgi:hypothetical protein